MVSTLTSKGQITVPKEIRMFLNVKPGEKVNFLVENGQVILKPIKALQDFRGCVDSKGKGDIAEERRQAKAAVGRRVLEELE